MRTWLAILPPLWLAACAGAGMSEKPITADEMPVVFAPQEVMDGEPKYDRVYNGRTGADYRRMTIGSRRAFAETGAPVIPLSGNATAPAPAPSSCP